MIKTYVHCKIVYNIKISSIFSASWGKIIIDETVPKPWTENTFNNLISNSIEQFLC